MAALAAVLLRKVRRVVLKAFVLMLGSLSGWVSVLVICPQEFM